MIFVDLPLLKAILDSKDLPIEETKMLLDYKQVWRDLYSAKQVKYYHMAQYIMVKATKKYTATDDLEKARSYATHNLTRAFSPVVKQIKLDNGTKKYSSLDRALYFCRHVTLAGQILRTDVSKLLTPAEVKFFNELGRKLMPSMVEEYSQREYVYIFVRQDISPEYQAVQAAHATLQAGYVFAKGDMDAKRMEGLYFTLVGVPDLDALAKVSTQPYAIKFHEPDLNNQLTAVVYQPVLARKRGKLLEHKLLVFRPTTNPILLLENK